MEEFPSSNPKLNNNDYDSDYPAFDDSPNLMMINFESKKVVSTNNINKKLIQNIGNGTQLETKVVKFPAKNVPKNPEKFLSELKNKVSQMKSQIIATKLPCGGFNILVKATKDKIHETVTLVERELEPKITKKLKIEPRRFTILTAKNFEIANEVLDDLSKNVHISSQQPNILVFNGISSDVNLAIQYINKYIENVSTTEKLVIEEIAQKYHPFIRGAFNCNISRIVSECDNCVAIDVPLPSTINRTITIIGPSEYRLKAKQEIMKIFDSIKKNLVIKTFKISISLHANIKRACGIDKILKETNVAVSLPFEGQKSDSVIFVGSSQDIPNAFQLALARARVYKYHEISCKPWIFKILKQTPNFSFNEIKIKYPHVWVSYLASKECIVLDGPQPHVDQIDQIYTNEINKINKNMTFTSIKIPITFVSYLKGSGSFVLDKISNATDTKIDISDISSFNAIHEKPIDSQITLVSIFGKKDNIDEASKLFEEYLEQLNEHISIEIEFDSLYMNYIINKCSTNSIHEELKQKFGDNFKINIRNSKNKRSSFISLQGKKGTILGAKSFIESLIKIVSNEIMIYDVSIPVAYHHLLIGKKGTIRDEIIDNSAIEKIIFPSNNSDDNNSNIITLVGPEKSCKLAEIIMMEKCNMDVQLDQIDLQLPKSLIEKLRMAGGIILRKIILSCYSSSVLVEDNIKTNSVNVYLPNGELQSLNKVRIHGYQLYTKVLAEKFKNYSKGSGLIVESFKVDENMIKAIIGKGGIQLKKFSQDSSVEIIIPNTKNKKNTDILEDNIFLMGTNQNDVNKLKSHILKFVKELKDTIEVIVDIPKKYYRKLLLKKNNQESYITQWNNQYSTLKITIPKDEDTDKQFKLKGPSKIVNNLKDEIHKLVKKWDDTIKIEFSIPYDHAQLLRNSEEPNFTSISQKCDVIIRSFRDGDKNAKPTTNTEIKVVIEGINKSVEYAQKLIMESGPVNEYLTAPRQYHRSLIGTKGSELKKIVNGMNVTLTFPDNTTNNDQILIRGPKKQVLIVIERLKVALKTLIKKQTEWELNNHMVELTIDSKWFSKLIGRGGKQIKNLKKQLNVSILIPKTDKLDQEIEQLDNSKNEKSDINEINDTIEETNGVSKVIFRGEKKLCENAKAKIEAMIDEWERLITVEIHIPKAHHGAIRGSKSSVITKIQKRYRVDVRFAPLNEENNDTIKITGIPENVEGAVKAINELEADILAKQIDNNDEYNIPVEKDMWANFKFSAMDKLDSQSSPLDHSNYLEKKESVKSDSGNIDSPNDPLQSAMNE